MNAKEFKKKLREKFQKDYEKFYPVKTLEELGFSRKKCIKCGNSFWTQDDNRETCNDAPCEGEFGFISNPPTPKRFGYVDAWKEFVKVMEKLGHTEIDRYPTVARWIPEEEFVFASILDFKMVLAGEADPPANPLVVPQFCVRFNDVDNVGYGRHYTLFVMMGQHVFNKPKKFIYFKDECIRYDYAWLTEGMGFKPKDIVFIEDQWAGGGNFGPSMEYFVKGLELGNAVFMQYELLPNGSYKELDILTIDMGSGLERYPWIANGTPTAYDMTFPQTLEKIKKAVGVKPSPLWKEFAPVSYLLNVDEMESEETTWKSLTERLGRPSREIIDELAPMRDVYILAEHARTLLFTLFDGALPSNVGGGYNLRFLLRRCLNILDENEWDLDLYDIIQWHSEELGHWQKELKMLEQTSIRDILDVEKQRYRRTLEKGIERVKKLLKKKKKISTDDLIKLYDSHGIPPAIVADIGKKMDVDVHVPIDFYARVQERHEIETEKQAKKMMVQGIRLKNEYPATRKLFYEDPYEKSFTAKVLGVEGKYLILDQTLFYPEGGGQVGDTGVIESVKVVDTQSSGAVVVHIMEKENAFKVGQTVNGEIDYERRRVIMSHHTGTHILNGAAKYVLGPHVWQAGAYKSPDHARLDITHYKALTREEEKLIEYHANRIVIENRLVISSFEPREEAEKKYGHTIYQGGVAPGKRLRILNISDWDIEACGGTHVHHTGDVGPIKILNTERIQDGIVRINFVAGMRAVERIQELDQLVHDISDTWGTPERDLLKKARDLLESEKQHRKKIELLERENLEMKLDVALMSSDDDIIAVKTQTDELKILLAVLSKFQSRAKDLKKVVLIFGNNSAVGISGNSAYDVTKILEKYCAIVKGKPEQANGFKIKSFPDFIRQ